MTDAQSTGAPEIGWKPAFVSALHWRIYVSYAYLGAEGPTGSLSGGSTLHMGNLTSKEKAPNLAHADHIGKVWPNWLAFPLSTGPLFMPTSNSTSSNLTICQPPARYLLLVATLDHNPIGIGLTRS